MIHRNSPLLRACALVWFTLALAPPPSSACEADKILDSWVLPREVNVVGTQSKRVGGAIVCDAAVSDEGVIGFLLNLVDVDSEPGDPSGDDDDVLASGQITGMVAPGPTSTRIAAARIYTVRCDENEEFPDTGEGHSGNQAELALEVMTGFRDSVQVVPSAGIVPGRCFPAGTSVLNLNLSPFSIPGLPPPVDLGFGVTLRVTAGEAHLEFITSAGGPLPDEVMVNVLSLMQESPFAAKAQDAPLTLTITGDGSFVDVTGTVSESGEINATGTGTVAGFPNIAVRMTGTLRGGDLNAQYAMGTNGGLPGGFPIVFDMQGESEDYKNFWNEAGDAILELANELALHNPPANPGGVDLEDAMVRLAGNLTVAQAGLRHAPQDGIAQAAFSGIATRLTEVADEVAVSTIAGRDTAAANLRRAASASEEAAQRIAGFIESPPDAQLNAGIAGWLETLDRMAASVRAFMLAVYGEEILTSVSAASFQRGPAAPDSILSGFGLIGAATASADSLPLPASLGGVSILLTDSSGREFRVGMFFTSSGQLNYLVPAGVAHGPALLTVSRDGVVVASGALEIEAVAPSVFTANADGAGVPAAFVQRVHPDGTSSFADAFTAAPAGGFGPARIDLSDDESLYFLALFGSGFRDADEVIVRIDGEAIDGVLFAASPQFVGLDQANVPLGPALRGRGVVTVELEAGGIVANPVEVAFE